jgi:hypothetical protein
MVIVGRIYEIIIVSQGVAKIIIKKKMKNKVVPVAVSLLGYWKDKMMDMNLKPKDKIKGNLYMESRLYKDKWYTDLYFNEIYLIENAPIKMGSTNLFYDKETGEVL